MNNQNNYSLLAINDKELSKLCLEIEGYTDSIAEIFSKVDMRINDLTDECNSTAIDALISSYDNFRKNYEQVKANINSYSADLNELIIKIRLGVKDIALKLDEQTEDVKKTDTAII